MRINFSSLKYIAQGFKKVALNDSKSVLTSKNNYKWVKDNKTILPSGTKITEFSDAKFIDKPDGSFIAVERHSNRSIDIKRSTKDGRSEILAENYMTQSAAKANSEDLKKSAERLTKKRLKFIEEFNKRFGRKTVKGEDGTISKFIYEKETGDMVSWWRKNAKGEVTRGFIQKILGKLGRNTTIVHADGTLVSKTRLGNKALGEKVVEKVNWSPEKGPFGRITKYETYNV